MDAMNKFTVLAGPVRGFGRDAAGSQTNDVGRQGEVPGVGLGFDTGDLCQFCVSRYW